MKRPLKSGSHELPTIETVPSPPSSHVTPEAAKSTSHSSQPATTKQVSTPSRSQMELPLRAGTNRRTALSGSEGLELSGADCGDERSDYELQRARSIRLNKEFLHSQQMSQDQVPSQENSRPKTKVPVISAVPRHGPVPRQEFPSQDIVPSQGSRRKGMLPSQDMVPSQDRNSRPVPKRNNNEGVKRLHEMLAPPLIPHLLHRLNMPSKSELIVRVDLSPLQKLLAGVCLWKAGPAGEDVEQAEGQGPQGPHLLPNDQVQVPMEQTGSNASTGSMVLLSSREEPNRSQMVVA
ncbi:hypothetical protein EMCRGX_G009839 [Ephydatia muelleri]